MKKEELLKTVYMTAIAFGITVVAAACSNDDTNDLEACGCTFYPEINQYLPKPMTAEDVIGEDTYISGKELRELDRLCLERCE